LRESCAKYNLLCMTWTQPQFDRTMVNRAGKALLDSSLDYETRDHVLEIVNNWRSAHGYPLQCIKMTLFRRAHKVDKSAIIAQRLKRLPSIQAKLKREPQMMLTQMQDIGGCRAVLSNIKDVQALVRFYEEAKSKNPRGRHELAKIKDYVKHPKKDGYRSIHLIYKYRSQSTKHKIYNDQKIEIQIRSKLQHAWATAVEIVDAFSGQGLKSGLKLNLGEPKWRRFFALMGSYMALREGCPIVEETSNSRKELKRELHELATVLEVETVLSGLKAALDFSKRTPDAVSYLLVLDLEKRGISVTAFPQKELAKANDEYLRIEKETQNNPKVLAVLVSVESLQALRTAYPNYYLDASAFLRVLRQAIA